MESNFKMQINIQFYIAAISDYDFMYIYSQLIVIWVLKLIIKQITELKDNMSNKVISLILSSFHSGLES